MPTQPTGLKETTKERHPAIITQEQDQEAAWDTPHPTRTGTLDPTLWTPTPWTVQLKLFIVDYVLLKL
jgi:hypothetical protein